MSYCGSPVSQEVRTQFLRFALVGAAGFFVDAGALYLFMHFGANHYTGRVLSYLAAATFTWALNRHYTFEGRQDNNLLREWLKFLAANVLGGLVNYSAYAALVALSETVSAWPVIGVGAGSLAGLVVNFILSRRLVFTGKTT